MDGSKKYTKAQIIIKATFATVACLIAFLLIHNFGFIKGNLFQPAAVFSAVNPGTWNDTHTWGLNGGLTGMAGPSGVVVSSITGEIYVADRYNKRVVVLNSDGTASTTYTYASLSSENAVAIAISPLTHEIFVLHQGDMDCAGSISVLNPDGTASTTYTNIGGYCPQGIAISSNGNIYIASNQDTVEVLNKDGTASTSYSSGGGNAESIVIAPSGEIYVAVVNGSGVVVLNPYGTASTTYNSVTHPWGIGISPITHEIYIVSAANGTILYVLNPNGTASTTYSGLGFNYPFGTIGFSQTGDIYVANLNNSSVSVINRDGTASTTFNGTQVSPSFVGTEGVDYPGIDENVNLGSATVTLLHDQNVHSITLSSGSTLDLAGHTLNVSGNWINNGGTFISNGGTVNFLGTTTQRILGENTFENLTDFASTTSSLLFDPTELTTITGNLFLSGTPGGYLNIGPASGSVSPVFSGYIGGQTRTGLNLPWGIAFSPRGTGEIYVADNQSHSIVVLNPDGTASTSYDGGIFAPMNPSGIAFSLHGDIYVSDIQSPRIIVLNPDGTASTTYTNGIFNGPWGVNVSPDGYIYVADLNSSRLEILNPDGTASTTHILSGPSASAFASNGTIYVATYYGNHIEVWNPDGTASTTYSDPGYNVSFGLAVSQITGKIYVSDQNNHRIAVLDSDGNFITTYDGGIFAPISPYNIALSSNDNIYIADSNHRVVVLNSDGTASTTYNAAVPGFYANPYGITHDSDGNIYVSDFNLNNIQKFDSDANFLNDFVSSASGIVTQPGQLAIDSQDNMYIVDKGNTRIVKLDSSGNLVASTTALPSLPGPLAIDHDGNLYTAFYSSTDNIQELAKLDQNFNILATTSTANNINFSPNAGLGVDPTGEFIYVADPSHNSIIKLRTSDFSFVSSVNPFDDVGYISMTSFVFDSQGNLYFSDSNNRILKFSSDLKYLSQFGASGTGDGQFSSPQQIMFDTDNLLYVVDTGNARVQKFTPVPFSPFNILSTGTTTFSYLSVSGADNISTDIFDCTDHCINGGSNIGWIFPQIHRAKYTIATTTETQTPFLPPLMPTSTPVLKDETVVPTPTQVPQSVYSALPKTFTQNLKPGDIGIQVKLLQQFLNTHGYIIASTGVGSPGNETMYFGLKTKEALIKLQEDHADIILTPAGLTSGTGRFYTLTRDYVNGVLLGE